MTALPPRSEAAADRQDMSLDHHQGDGRFKRPRYGAGPQSGRLEFCTEAMDTMDATQTETQTDTKTLRKLRITELDRTLKTRSEVREAVAEEYSELIKSGVKLPAPVVFEHEGAFYLSSGFHRIRAAEILEMDEVECEVRTGDRLKAISFGCLANKMQVGERLTKADRNAAIRLALGLFPELSDGSIAQTCGVDHKTVAARRKELVATREIPELTDRVGLDGKTRRLPPPRLAPAPHAEEDGAQTAPQVEDSVATNSQSPSGITATLTAIGDQREETDEEQPDVDDGYDGVELDGAPAADSVVSPVGRQKRVRLFAEVKLTFEKTLGAFARAVDDLREWSGYEVYKELRHHIEAAEELVKKVSEPEITSEHSKDKSVPF